MTSAHDADTLAFYDREAATYAAQGKDWRSPGLEEFLARLAPGARILELGCGGGRDARAMLAAGFDVTATDGSARLTAEAERALGRQVRVMRFDELDECETYDGVWAHACLLHVPHGGLADVLARVWRALTSGGLFYASFKGGDGQGGGRDALGRYNNLVSREALEAAYRRAGPWAALTIVERPGGGFDGAAYVWLAGWAVKGSNGHDGLQPR